MNIKLTIYILLSLFTVTQSLAQVSIKLCNSTTTTSEFTGYVYDSGGPNGIYDPLETCSLLIDPGCVNPIKLIFSAFNTQGKYDFLRVYDGSTATDSTLLLIHSGNRIPSPVTAKSGTMLVTWTSNHSGNYPGFSARWYTAFNSAGSAPVADFLIGTSNPIYSQSIQFNDNSSSGTTAWFWDFGDSSTSVLSSPTHTYGKSGSYSVSLTSMNCFGVDSLSKNVFLQTPSNIDYIPKTINLSTTSCEDSLTFPLKIYNNDSTSFSYNFTTGQGNLINDTSKKTFTLSGDKTFHAFNIFPDWVKDSIELEIYLNTYTNNTRYTDLYIEGIFIQRLTSRGTHKLHFNTSMVKPLLNDSTLEIQLQNSSNYVPLSGDYHQVILTVPNQSWIRLNAITGVIAPYDSTTVNVVVSSKGLASGIKKGNIRINSIIAGFPINIPIKHIHSGRSQLDFDTANCISHGTVAQYSLNIDTIAATNKGCDTLFIDSLLIGNLDLSVVAPKYILPYKTVELLIKCQPSNVGPYKDTISVFTNEGVNQICINGISNASSFPWVRPEVVYDTLLKCTDSLIVPIVIGNLGGDTLNAMVEPGHGLDKKIVSGYAFPNAITNHTFNVHHSFDTLFLEVYINGDYGQSGGQSHLYIEGDYYSTLGGFGYNIHRENFILTGEQLANWLSDSVLHIQLKNTSGVSNSTFYKRLHEVRVHYDERTQWIETSPKSISVLPGDSTTINFVIKGLFTNGNYFGKLNLSTNSDEGSISIPVYLNVDGLAEAVIYDSIVDFAKVEVGNTGFQKVLLYNYGCDTLIINSISNTNNDFAINFDDTILHVGDTSVFSMEFAPTVQVVYKDTIIINTNVGTYRIHLNGIGVPPPSLNTSPPSLTAQINNCGDSIIMPLKIYNAGPGILYYSVTDSSEFESNVDLLADYRILILNYNSLSYTLYLIKQLLAVQFPKASILETTSSQDSVLRQLLEDIDILIIPPGTSVYQVSTVRSAIMDFVNSGGGIIQIGPRSTAQLQAPGLINGSTLGDVSSGQLFKTSINHPLLEDIPNSYSVGFQHSTGYYEINNKEVLKLVEFSGNPMAGAIEYGLGKVVFIGHTYPRNSDEDANNLLRNAIRWVGQFHGHSKEWLNMNSPIPLDTLASNDSTLINVLFNSANANNGYYYSKVYIHSNDPISSIIEVQCTLEVNGEPEIAFLDSSNCQGFDSIPNNTSKYYPLYYENTGCDTLNLTNVSFNGIQFNASIKDSIVPPGKIASIDVYYSPQDTGAHFDSLIISHATGQIKHCVKGYSKKAPNIQVTPTTVHGTINSCNDSIIIPLYLKNTGLEDLFIKNVGRKSKRLVLENILSKLDSNYQQITSAIPNIHNFSGSISSDKIYRNFSKGNLIGYRTESLYISQLKYTNGLIDTASAFHLTQYFTSDFPGLFVFAGDIQDLEKFQISGNLPQGSNGTVSGTKLTGSYQDKEYTAYIKKVYGGSHASVNHLIITRRDSTIQHNYSASASYDDHSISNIENVDRVYYLLFSGKNGQFYADSVFQKVFDKFIEVINEGVKLDWLDFTNFTGSIYPNDSQQLAITMRSRGLSNGQHTTKLKISSNDPADSVYFVDCILNVNGNPEVFFDTNTCKYFGSVFQFSSSTDSIMVKNIGCDNALFSSASSGSNFSIIKYPDTLKVGDSTWIQIKFHPTLQGSFSDTLQLFHQSSNTKICVSGLSIDPPEISTSPPNFIANTNICGDSLRFNISIRNTGSDTLKWSSHSYLDSGYIFDDFENGKSAIWDKIVGGYFSDTNDCSGVISGSHSMMLRWGSNRYLQSIPLNLTNSAYIRFDYLNGGLKCSPADDPSEALRLEYSIDGGNSWQLLKITDFTTSTVESLEAKIPNSAKTDSTQLRLIQLNHSSLYGDAWLIDNFEILLVNQFLYSDVLDASPQTGYVPLGDSMDVEILLIPDSLNIGRNTVYIVFLSNDPLHPIDSVPVYISVNGKPCAAFNSKVTSSCSGSVFFTDSSSAVPLSWKWYFGDGDSSSQKHPIHTYDSAGTYTTKLIVCNSYGCDSTSSQINIPLATGPRFSNCPPPLSEDHCCGSGIRNVELDSINNASGVGDYEDFSCTYQTTLFTDSSYTLTVTSGNYEAVRAWIDYNDDGDFGSAEMILSSNAINGNHTDTFIVPTNPVINKVLRMRIGSTDDSPSSLSSCYGASAGQYEDYSIVVQNTNPPISAFTFIDSCLATVLFKDESMSFPSNWLWYFGDGDSSILKHPSHTYKQSGQYNVKLVVSNNFGDDSITQLVNVNKPNPIINTIGNLVINKPISFSIGGVSPTSYSWDFGDNSLLDSSATPSHIYTQTGLYYVSANLVDSISCLLIATDTLNIITTGLKEAIVSREIHLNPNPNKGLFTVAMNDYFTDFTIEIFNSSGSIVYYKEYKGSREKVNLRIQNLAKGLYNFRITDAEKSQNIKMIVQ